MTGTNGTAKARICGSPVSARRFFPSVPVRKTLKPSVARRLLAERRNVVQLPRVDSDPSSFAGQDDAPGLASAMTLPGLALR